MSTARWKWLSKFTGQWNRLFEGKGAKGEDFDAYRHAKARGVNHIAHREKSRQRNRRRNEMASVSRRRNRVA